MPPPPRRRSYWYFPARYVVAQGRGSCLTFVTTVAPGDDEAALRVAAGRARSWSTRRPSSAPASSATRWRAAPRRARTAAAPRGCARRKSSWAAGADQRQRRARPRVVAAPERGRGAQHGLDRQRRRVGAEEAREGGADRRAADLARDLAGRRAAGRSVEQLDQEVHRLPPSGERVGASAAPSGGLASTTARSAAPPRRCSIRAATRKWAARVRPGVVPGRAAAAAGRLDRRRGRCTRRDRDRGGRAELRRRVGGVREPRGGLGQASARARTRARPRRRPPRPSASWARVERLGQDRVDRAAQGGRAAATAGPAARGAGARTTVGERRRSRTAAGRSSIEYTVAARP